MVWGVLIAASGPALDGSLPSSAPSGRADVEATGAGFVHGIWNWAGSSGDAKGE